MLALDYTGDQILLFRNALHSGSTNRHGAPGGASAHAPVPVPTSPPALAGLSGTELTRRLEALTPIEARALSGLPDPSGEGAAE